METSQLSARQKGFRIGILISQALLLTSCFKDAPINVQEAEPGLIGTWLHHYESKETHRYELNSVYFSVDAAGNASYHFCEIENKTGTISSTSRKSVVFPDARLIGFDQTKMTIESSLFFLNIEHNIDVEFGPFTSSEGSYLGIGKYTLSKVDKLDSWDCPE